MSYLRAPRDRVGAEEKGPAVRSVSDDELEGAEEKGFEPLVELPLRRFSKPLP